MPRKVCIINSDKPTEDMFKQAGWKIVKPNDADMFQFTGSGDSDVPPDLYGEAVHKSTRPDYGRAKMEQIYFNIAKRERIPMAGICYGGQFLNVMNGGWCWQNVNNHYKPHYITDQITGDTYLVSSAHHQAMRTARDAVILAKAGETTWREWCTKHGVEKSHGIDPRKESDVEVCLYPDTKCLCVQYHPEYEGYSSLAQRYFALIEENLFSSR